MADDITKSVLLKIESNANQTRQDLIAMNLELARVKDLQEKSKPNSEAYIKWGTEVRAAQNNIRGFNKDLDNAHRAQNANEESVNALTARLALLRKEWAAGSAVQRDQVSPEILKVTNHLKELEKGIGDNRREVGNYALAGVSLHEKLGELDTMLGVRLKETFGQLSSGIKAAAGDLTKLSKEQTTAIKAGLKLADAEKKAKDTALLAAQAQIKAKEATELSTIAQKGLAAGTVTAQAATKAETLAVKENALAAKADAVALAANTAAENARTVATVTATIATKGLNTVMKANVIGFIVLALAGLIAYLSQTNEGSKLLQRGIAALSAIFQAVIMVLGTIGKAFVGAFGGTEGIITSLKNAFDLVLIPLKTFFSVLWDVAHLDFTKALDDLGKGLDGLTHSVVANLGTVYNVASGVVQSVNAAGKAIINLDLSKIAIAGRDAVAARQAQTKAEREFGVESTRVAGEIEVLRIKAGRRDLQAGVRQKALDEARKLERGLRLEDIKLAEANLDTVNKEQALLSKKDLDATAEARKRLEEAKVKQEVGEASLEKIEGRISMKGASMAAKAAAAAQKIQDITLASYARELEASMDARGKEMAVLDEFFRVEIEKVKGNGAALEQLKKEQHARQAALQEKYALEDEKKIEEIGKQSTALAVEEIINVQNKIIAGIDAATAAKMEKIGDANEQENIIVQKQEVRIAQLRKLGYTDQAADLSAARDRELAIIKANNDLSDKYFQQGEKKKVEARKKFMLEEAAELAQAAQVKTNGIDDASQDADIRYENAKFALELNGARGQAAKLELIQAKHKETLSGIDLKYAIAKKEQDKQMSDQIGNIAGGLQSLVKKGSAAYMALFLVQKAAAINSIMLDANIARMKATAVYVPPLNAVPMAMITIQEIASIAMVAASALKFKSGGFVSDKKGNTVTGAGTGTSDSIPAWLSSGESVINAKSTAMFGSVLSRINEMGGGRAFSVPNNGRAFAAGGIYSDGGSSQRFYQQPAVSNDLLANTLAAQLINNPPPIYVDVKEINAVQSRVATVKDRVSL